MRNAISSSVFVTSVLSISLASTGLGEVPERRLAIGSAAKSSQDEVIGSAMARLADGTLVFSASILSSEPFAAFGCDVPASAGQFDYRRVLFRFSRDGSRGSCLAAISAEGFTERIGPGEWIYRLGSPPASFQRSMRKISATTGDTDYIRDLPREVVGGAFDVLPDGRFWISGTTNPESVTGIPRLDQMSADSRAILRTVTFGERGDRVVAVSVDGMGNVYAVGTRIWKFSPEGELQWSTVLQNWYSPLLSLEVSRTAVGADGSLYVAGCTTPRVGLETSAGAYQAEPFPNEILPPASAMTRCVDGYVARFSPEGERIYATLLGGRFTDQVSFLGVDTQGWATVIGRAPGPGLRTRDLVATRTLGGPNQFVARIAPDGRMADYVTYVGYELTTGSAAFVDPDGTLHVFGQSPRTPDGTRETFIAKIGPAVATYPRVDAVANPEQFGRLAYAGARLLIEGETFGADTRVWLGERLVAAEVISERRLEVVIPEDQAEGAVELRVESGGSRSAPLRMLVEARPTG